MSDWLLFICPSITALIDEVIGDILGRRAALDMYGSCQL
jgi:hypothetical protein